MKKQILLYTLMALIGCKKVTTQNTADIGDSLPDTDSVPMALPDSAKQKHYEEPEERPVDKRFKRKLKEGARIFVLHIHQHHNSFDFEKVEVFENKKLLQTLPTDSAYAYNEDEIEMDLADDANFDGYKDFKLLNWHGMVDTTYNFYLYSPKTKKYVLEKSLSKIMNPFFDYKAKTIGSSYHIGPSEFHSETYKWKKGKAVLVDEKIEGSDEMGKP